MLFAFDWNSVGEKALIGAVVGGAIGLIVGVIQMVNRKKNADAKKPVGDVEDDAGEPEDRPRKRRED